MAEGLRELARDDPHLVRVALGDLRQDLEVLVREQLWIGVAFVDRLEDRTDSLRLALGTQDLGLLLPLRPEDRALLLALGGEDLRLLDPFCRKYRSPLVALRPHLLLHRLLDRPGRVDGLELDAIHANPPLPGRLIEDDAELRVDLVP